MTDLTETLQPGDRVFRVAYLPGPLLTEGRVLAVNDGTAWVAAIPGIPGPGRGVFSDVMVSVRPSADLTSWSTTSSPVKGFAHTPTVVYKHAVTALVIESMRLDREAVALEAKARLLRFQAGDLRRLATELGNAP